MDRRSLSRLTDLVVAVLLTTAGALGLVAPDASASGTTATSLSITAPTTATLTTSVVFSATLQASQSSLGGTVVFFLDGTELGCGRVSVAAAPGASGTASCSVASLQATAGPALLVALYSGDTNYAASSESVPVQILGAPTTTTLEISPDPVAVSSTVTYTATISGADPGASVLFTEDGVAIAACDGSGGEPIAGGIASCSDSSPISAGEHVILASYLGSSTTAPSTSAAVIESVGALATPTPTTSTLDASIAPSAPATVASTTTLVDTVRASSGAVMGGSVTFLDGGQAITSCTNLALSPVLGTATGQVTCTLASGLGFFGAHELTAVYLGDGPDALAPSAATRSLEAAGVPDALTLSSSVDPTVSSSNVTLVARVNPAPTTPGVVQFAHANGPLACSSSPTGLVALTNGTATCVVSAASGSVDDFVAVYVDNGAKYAPAESDVPQSVSASGGGGTAVSGTTLSVAPELVGPGGDASLVATVSGGTPAPTGVVTFEENGAPVGSCSGTLSPAGSRSCAVSLPSFTSPLNLTASYVGDANYATSAAAIVLGPGPTGGASAPLALTASPAAPTTGGAVSYTASLAATGSTGTVSFERDGTAISGCAAVPVAGSQATCATTAGSPGAHDVLATYSGDSLYGASAGLLAAPALPAPAPAPAPSGGGGGGSGGGGPSAPSAPTPPVSSPTTPAPSAPSGGGGTGPTAPQHSAQPGHTTAHPKAILVLEVPRTVAIGTPLAYRARVAGGAAAPGGAVTFTVDGTPIPGCEHVPLRGARQVTCTLPSGFAAPGDRVVGLEYSGSTRLGSASATRAERLLPRWHGLWVASANGTVRAYGGAANGAPAEHVRAAAPVVALVRTPDDRGYWILTARGVLRTVGDAHRYGAAPVRDAPYVSLAPLASGTGYYLLDNAGHVFAEGSARLHGEPSRSALGAPAVAIAVTADGGGYWVLSRRGTIVSLGDAARLASPHRHGENIVAFRPTLDGRGALLLSASGAVLAAGDAHTLGGAAGAFRGGAVALVPTGDERGYWLIGRDGAVRAVGDARSALAGLPHVLPGAPLAAGAGT